MVSLWIESSWVRELTVVVLLVQGVLSVLGNADEVIDVKLVGEVLVEVVLEVLEQVHVLLDEVVSSDSWEGEGGIVEFPGVDGNLWILALLLELLVDLHGLLVMLSVEVTREVVKLNIELGLRNIDGWLATDTDGGLRFQLDESLRNWWSEHGFLFDLGTLDKTNNS